MTRYASFSELQKAIAGSDVTLPAELAKEGTNGTSLLQRTGIATQGAGAFKDTSHLEALFLQIWGVCGGATLEREFAFDPTRRWRFDFAHPDTQIAFEIEGGLYKGRHTQPAGYSADCEKYNAATMQGWRVLRLTPILLNVSTIQPLADWLHHEFSTRTVTRDA